MSFLQLGRDIIWRQLSPRISSSKTLSMSSKDFTFQKHIIFHLAGLATFHNCTFGQDDHPSHIQIILKQTVWQENLKFQEHDDFATYVSKNRITISNSRIYYASFHVQLYTVEREILFDRCYFLKGWLKIQYHSKVRFALAKLVETMMIETELVIGYSLEFLYRKLSFSTPAEMRGFEVVLDKCDFQRYTVADHIVESKGATLKVFNSSFTKESKSWETLQGLRQTRPGAFIDFEKMNNNSDKLIVHNTVFKAPSLKPDPNIIITNSPDFYISNATFLCSGNVHYQNPDADHSYGQTDKYIFSCSSLCGQNAE